MKRRWMASAVLVAAALTFAAEPSVPELMRRARSAMSMRSSRSGPFRLRGQVEIHVRGNLHRGTYEEIWAAPGKWRDDVRVGAFHQTRVVSGETLWRVKSQAVVPYWFYVLDSAIRLEALQQEPLEFRRLRYFRAGAPGKWLTCADFRSAPMLCFEPDAGLLVRQDSTELRVEYSEFHEWQGHNVPMRIDLLYEGEPSVTAVIENIAPAGDVPSAAFNPPPNAEERCTNPVKPVLVKSVKPGRGPRFPFSSGFVRLYGEVDTSGKFNYTGTVAGDQRALVRLSMNAVRDWRFRPATCKGQPVTFPTTIDFEFEGPR